MVCWIRSFWIKRFDFSVSIFLHILSMTLRYEWIFVVLFTIHIAKLLLPLPLTFCFFLLCTELKFLFDFEWFLYVILRRICVFNKLNTENKYLYVLLFTLSLFFLCTCCKLLYGICHCAVFVKLLFFLFYFELKSIYFLTR